MWGAGRAGNLDVMPKNRKSTQAVATEPDHELTWKETIFVEEYVLNNGNATRAAIAAGYSKISAHELGSRLLKKVEIQRALKSERESLADALGFDRKRALQILVGMATCTQADIAPVLKNPDSRAAQKALGYKRYGIQSAKKSFKHGNEVKLVDRKAALESLWDKLGLGDQGTGSGNWFDGFEQLADAVREIKGKKR